MPRIAHLTPAALIALAVLLSLGGALGGGFVWDDRPLIVENRLIKDPSAVGTILSSGFWQAGDRHDRFRAFFRPLTTLTYALDYVAWGLRPIGFHITNLLLHFLCCLLIYHLCLQEQVGRRAALVGALLFAVHPVHVESVAWISGRTDLLAALFTLLAFHLIRGAPAASRPAGRRAAALSSFALALFCKEVAATLPLLVFAWAAGTHPGPARERLREAARDAWPFAAVLGVYLVARRLALGEGGEPLYRPDPASFLGTALFALGRYVTLWLLPVRLDAHYPYPPLDGLWRPSVAVAAIMVGVLLETARRLWATRTRDAFWIGWFLIALLPVLAFGSFGDILLADRFLYLPSAGAAVLLARLLSPWLDPGLQRRAGRVALASACAVLVALGLLSVRRTRFWRDDLILFETMARTSPASAMVRCNYGLALYDAGDYARAKEELRRAIRLVPGYALAHNNLAAALEREGNLAGAAAEYLEALRLAPLQIEGRVNLGSVLVRLGRKDEGLSILRRAVREHPRYPPALYALADTFDRTGQGRAALPYLETAIGIDRFYPNAYYLKGKLLYEEGDGRGAAQAMQIFLSLWDESGPHKDAALRVIARAGGTQAPPPLVPMSPLPPAR
jgi:tetratricopeptide (TPR) repeat protein